MHPPPPSPTDDPLLLRSRMRSPRPPIPTHACETPQLGSSPDKPASPIKRNALDFPLPGIPSDVEDESNLVSVRSCPPIVELTTPEVPPTPCRMKGFFFSYLPTLKKKPQAQKTHEPARSLPSPEVMEKTRGSVITPQSKPLPWPVRAGAPVACALSPMIVFRRSRRCPSGWSNCARCPRHQ